jgi:hypothetical protein
MELQYSADLVPFQGPDPATVGLGRVITPLAFLGHGQRPPDLHHLVGKLGDPPGPVRLRMKHQLAQALGFRHMLGQGFSRHGKG